MQRDRFQKDLKELNNDVQGYTHGDKIIIKKIKNWSQ